MGYGAAGVDLFTGLLDTPGSYVGQSGKLPFIKVTETGLEFLDPDAYATTKVFDGSTTTPPTIYTTPLTAAPYAYLASARGIYEFGCVTVGDWLYIFGAQNRDGGYSNSCYRFHLTAHYWEKLASLPTADGGHTNYRNKCSGYYNGKIYMACLFDGSNFYKKILEYDIANNTWAAVADFPVQSVIDEIWVCCTSLGLYLAQSGSDFGGRMDRMDYTTHAWTVRTVIGGSRSVIAGVITDEIYAVRRDTLATYKYTDATDSWADQVQASPLAVGQVCYDENHEAIWTAQGNAIKPPHYRYTPAGGWVAQFTMGRDTYPADWCVVSADTGKVYFIFGWEGGQVGTRTEAVGGGCIHTYEPDGVWKLLIQTFNVADLLIIYEEAGIPVVVEKSGTPLFISSGMDTVYIVSAGTYIFSLSKDFEKKSVQIWRAVWG